MLVPTHEPSSDQQESHLLETPMSIHLRSTSTCSHGACPERRERQKLHSTETPRSRRLDAQLLRDDVQTEKKGDDQAVLPPRGVEEACNRYLIVIVQPRSASNFSGGMRP